MPSVIDSADWLSDLAAFRGEWQGGAHGSAVCVIADRLEGPGGGPRLHRHPYPEVFIVRRGTGLFTVGDEQILATEGPVSYTHSPSPRDPKTSRMPSSA